MKIRLLAVGTRMPAWVEAGFENFRKRLPLENSLQLIEVAAGGQRDDIRNRKAEGERLLARVTDRDFVVVLDEKGRSMDTVKLSQEFEKWRESGRDLVLLIGGASGLSQTCKKRADFSWSLSPLTFPHALVRVLVAEQLYRAWSVLMRHPYHRGCRSDG